jgi:hypothetical protein
MFARLENQRGLLWVVLILLALVPRLGVFPINENLYGDAVARTELAMQWADSPHWIDSFGDGARQFGPLHLYLVGLALKVGAHPEHAARWVSLVFGLLGVFPLFALTRRYFGLQAGLWAALGYGLWGMHVQMSTTGGSEAISLFFVLWALALFAPGIEERRFGSLAFSAIVLNFACALRYDNWLLIPLLTGLLLFNGKDWVANVALGLLFAFLAVPFPMVWMQGNELAHGSPVWPIRFIEQFHKSWFDAAAGTWGQVPYRVWNLVFWPGTAILTLSPLVALFGFSGMTRAYQERPAMRWLVWTALVPTAYFTVRSVVTGSFSPLARFTVTQVALVLPFVALGIDAWAQGRTKRSIRLAQAATVILALAFPLSMGLLTFRREGRVEEALRPVSPVSTNPVALMSMAKSLKAAVPPGGALVIDTSPRYEDLQVAFFSGLDESQLVRYRWSDVAKRLQSLRPSHLLLMRGGALSRELGEIKNGAPLSWRNWLFEPVSKIGSYRLYRRVP